MFKKEVESLGKTDSNASIERMNLRGGGQGYGDGGRRGRHVWLALQLGQPEDIPAEDVARLRKRYTTDYGQK